MGKVNSGTYHLTSLLFLDLLYTAYTSTKPPFVLSVLHLVKYEYGKNEWYGMKSADCPPHLYYTPLPFQHKLQKKKMEYK
jgi:hypothetical protein